MFLNYKLNKISGLALPPALFIKCHQASCLGMKKIQNKELADSIKQRKLELLTSVRNMLGKRLENKRSLIVKAEIEV